LFAFFLVPPFGNRSAAFAVVNGDVLCLRMESLEEIGFIRWLGVVIYGCCFALLWIFFDPKCWGMGEKLHAAAKRVVFVLRVRRVM